MVYVLARPITMIGGMEAKSAEMCLDMMFWITIVKPIVWMFAFIPAYGMRAAGDVKFSLHYYVDLPLLPVRLSDPGMWHGTDGCLDRNVHRLDGTCDRVWSAV